MMNQKAFFLTGHEIALLEVRIAGINFAGFSICINIVINIPAFVFISYEKHQNIRSVDIFFGVSIQCA